MYMRVCGFFRIEIGHILLKRRDRRCTPPDPPPLPASLSRYGYDNKRLRTAEGRGSLQRLTGAGGCDTCALAHRAKSRRMFQVHGADEEEPSGGSRTYISAGCLMMEPGRRGIIDDASRFTHGAFYHAFYDRHQAEARGLVVDMVPVGASVLDVASGTGELCFELAARRRCRVVGVDLSSRMIEFAGKRNPYESVRFVQGDVTDLAGLGLGAFDFATLMFLLHELPRERQVEALNAALRVARKVVVVDSQVPLPWNLHGMALRIVEASGGRNHYRWFADYLAGGGIDGVLADSSIRAPVVQRSSFWHGCREMVVLQGQGEESPRL